jgi:sugar/nucleoside kinase (ribokinase family)
VIGTLGDLVEDIAVRMNGPINVASDTPASIGRRRGGSAANAAVAVVRAGGSARFIGQVGDDPIGDALVTALEREGVQVAGRRGGRTGTIVVLVDHLGERSMLTDRGACGDLVHPEHAWLDGLAVLHVPAYSLFEGHLAETAAMMIEWAHARSVTVSIDASSTSHIEAFGASVLRALLMRLEPDVLFCNELEAEALGGTDTLMPLAARAVVVKHGSEPAVVLASGEAAVAVPVPAFAGVRDTTGAGDAFAAGFLMAIADGASPVEAAEAGHRTARTAILSVSATP